MSGWVKAFAFELLDSHAPELRVRVALSYIATAAPLDSSYMVFYPGDLDVPWLTPSANS